MQQTRRHLSYWKPTDPERCLSTLPRQNKAESNNITLCCLSASPTLKPPGSAPRAGTVSAALLAPSGTRASHTSTSSYPATLRYGTPRYRDASSDVAVADSKWVKIVVAFASNGRLDRPRKFDGHCITDV